MMTILIAIVILALFFWTVNIIDINRFVVKKYEVKTEKINKELTIAFLSDLHNREFGRGNNKLIKAVEELDADIIVCGGDMLTATHKGTYNKAIAFFENMKQRPVYYSLGNHEHKLKICPEVYGSQYNDYVNAIKDKNVIVLENEYSDIEDSNIRIQGLMIDRKYYIKFANHILTAEDVGRFTGKSCNAKSVENIDENHGIEKAEKEEKYEILLAHNPEYFPAYAEYGADLVLSGHVHGGIMRLPVVGGVISPKFKLFPKYDGGLFTFKNSTMILSRGLGCHTLPVRIFNPGELILVKLIPDRS